MLLAYRHVDYSHELWWQFELDGARAALAARARGRRSRARAPSRWRGCCAPRRRPRAPTAPADLERAATLVAASPRAGAPRAGRRQAAALPRVGRGLPDVRRPPPQLDRDGRSRRARPTCAASSPGSSASSPTGTAVSPPSTRSAPRTCRSTSISGSSCASSARRRACRSTASRSRAARARGCGSAQSRGRARGLPLRGARRATRSPRCSTALRAVSDAWLAQQEHAREALLARLLRPRLPAALPARAWCAAASGSSPSRTCGRASAREELSIDLMRYADDAPSGVMEYLFAELLLWGSSEGYRWFSLGMAPLSGFEQPPARAALEPARRAALPPRRALLQLPGPARVQGQVRSGLGAALPRRAGRARDPVRADRRRGADLGRRDRRGRALASLALTARRAAPRARARREDPLRERLVVAVEVMAARGADPLRARERAERAERVLLVLAVEALDQARGRCARSSGSTGERRRSARPEPAGDVELEGARSARARAARAARRARARAPGRRFTANGRTPAPNE